VLIPVVAAQKFAAVPAAPGPLAPVEIERSLAWQNGRLVFESAPLSAIVAEFNRYNRRSLVIADEELGAHRFGGTFVANDPETFVELLRASYDVVVEQRAGEIELRMRK
jgi:transmembrane sensor